MANKTDLEFALEHSRIYGCGKYPDVMPLDFGMDLHLETKPELYPEINYAYDFRHPDVKERTVKLVITTFRGMCWEAVHYYGKLRADGINIIEEHKENDGKVHRYVVGGHICEEFSKLPNKDFYDSWYDFEILRPVTQEDIDKDPDRWHGYEVGWTTNAFESKEEIIKIAKKVVAARFPGWKFKIVDETK